jgi:hypothetical protein
MTKLEKQYESYKNYLKSLGLSSKEYEKMLKEWCRKNGY